MLPRPLLFLEQQGQDLVLQKRWGTKKKKKHKQQYWDSVAKPTVSAGVVTV
jgi:hypothetical protein